MLREFFKASQPRNFPSFFSTIHPGWDARIAALLEVIAALSSTILKEQLQAEVSAADFDLAFAQAEAADPDGEGFEGPTSLVMLTSIRRSASLLNGRLTQT